MELGKFFNLVKDRIGMADLGVLKVAMMVAAIDGDIMDSELEAFELMAKRCRGYSPESYAAALKEAMHAAGYLMIAMKRDTETEFVKEFIAEAKAALPNGFANLPIEDIRLAVVIEITAEVPGGIDDDYVRLEVTAGFVEDVELALHSARNTIEGKILEEIPVKVFSRQAPQDSLPHIDCVHCEFCIREKDLQLAVKRVE